LHGIVSSLVLVLFPLASELNSDREKLLQIYLKATKIISMIVVFIVVSLAVQSKTFLGLWMGPAFAEYSSTLLMIHIVCFGFISIMSISWQLSEGLGKPWLNAAANAISTVIGISLMVLLIEPMGLVGIAIARLTAFATIFFSIFIVESRFFKRVQTGFWSSMLGNLAVATTAAAVIEYLISHTLAVHWASLSLSLLAGGIAYCFVLWLLDFVTPDEKILLRHALSR
jgi:O-antigen/teichoic acid export membrane protein